MINFSIPPKPGEVTLDGPKTIELLYLSGQAQNREALIAGAGYAIGALLMRECETTEDATQIISELIDQAKEAFDLHNREYDPVLVNTTRLASIMEYGIQAGRIAVVTATA